MICEKCKKYFFTQEDEIRMFYPLCDKCSKKEYKKEKKEKR
jgi:hypothetical protein